MSKATGWIALAGGAEFGSGSRDADRRLIDLAGGPNGRIVILPTAAAHQRPELAGRNGVRHFRGLGARQVASVLVVDAASAGDPEHAAVLRDARLIYLTGGDPRHLRHTLAGSVCWTTIVEAYRAGAVIAGSSAGAMVLGAGRPATDQSVGVGLGLAPRVIVQPHRRGPAQFEGVEAGVAVIAIAEETTLVGQAGQWENLGQGSVWVTVGIDAPREIRPGDTWREE